MSSMGTGKQYDEEFKKQAIKLAKEIGTKAAADERRVVLQPWGQVGELHYERFEDYDLEILFQ